MSSSPLKCAFLLVIVFLLPACATTINTSVLMPARESGVTDYRKVAVLSSDNNRERDYAANVEAVVASIKDSDDEKFFTVVDRANIDKIIKEQQFQMTLADDDSIVEFGKLLGADAIWVASGGESYNEARYRQEYTECNDQGKNCRKRYKNCVKKTLTVEVIPKLLSVSTGRVIYSRRIADGSYADMCETDSQVARNELESSVISDIFNSFRLDIAPYFVNVELELMTSKSGMKDKQAKQLLKDGVKFAKDGRMERACTAWSDGLKLEKSSVSLRYNYALCLEIGGQYEEALSNFKSIERTLPAGDSASEMVMESISRNKANIDNKKKVEMQRGKR